MPAGYSAVVIVVVEAVLEQPRYRDLHCAVVTGVEGLRGEGGVGEERGKGA